MKDELIQWLSNSGKIVIIGIGNPLRSDDSIGIQVVQSLQGKTSEYVYLIESETVPESYMQQIIDLSPTHILMIDAAFLNLEAGSMRFMTSIKTTGASISTHFLPIRLFWQYISETAKSKIAIILIQPQNVDFGEELSAEAKTTLKNLTKILLSIPTIAKNKNC